MVSHQVLFSFCPFTDYLCQVSQLTGRTLEVKTLTPQHCLKLIKEATMMLQTERYLGMTSDSSQAPRREQHVKMLASRTGTLFI